MARKDAFERLRKALKDEENFRKRESELLEQARQRAAAEAERRKLDEAHSEASHQLLERL
jgi:hypothetical protein